MKTQVEITLKSLSLSGAIPEKALRVSRNLLTVEMIWPKVGSPRKSASRQVKMRKGKVDFTAEPWAKRVLFREEIDGHTAFTVSIAEPVSMQKLHRLLPPLPARERGKLLQGQHHVAEARHRAEERAALVHYAYSAAEARPRGGAPFLARDGKPPGKYRVEAYHVIIQGVLDYDDLPAAGETKEVVIPLTRPKFSRKIGTLTLLVQGQKDK